LLSVATTTRTGPLAPADPVPDDRYKWIALSNTTLAVLLATLDGSITLIAMPAIFRGFTSTRCCPPTASTCCG